jgi:hypothetical protein
MEREELLKKSKEELVDMVLENDQLWHEKYLDLEKIFDQYREELKRVVLAQGSGLFY